MTGIVVAETCWAYKKYNKIISGIYLVLILQLSQWCTAQQTSSSNWFSPTLSGTTFPNFQGISDLLFEMYKF